MIIFAQCTEKAHVYGSKCLRCHPLTFSRGRRISKERTAAIFPSSREVSIQSTVRISLSTSRRTIAEPQPSPTPSSKPLFIPLEGVYTRLHGSAAAAAAAVLFSLLRSKEYLDVCSDMVIRSLFFDRWSTFSLISLSSICFSLLQAPKKDKAPPPSSKPAKSGGGKQKKKVTLGD